MYQTNEHDDQEGGAKDEKNHFPERHAAAVNHVFFGRSENVVNNHQLTLNLNKLQLIHSALNDAIGNSDDSSKTNLSNSIVDWDTVRDLLRQLSNQLQPLQKQGGFCHMSFENETYGRSFLTKLLGKNPPPICLQEALQVFPNALDNSPAAFFTACRASTPQIVGHMMRHLVDRMNKSNQKQICPYPWIFSPYISVDGARAIVRAFPEGVRYKPASSSSYLSSNNERYSPLEYIFFSQRMVDRRDFDASLWQKIKLILAVAGSTSSGISPVHTILEQILARPDALDGTPRAQHILWLLYQFSLSDRWVFEKRLRGLSPLHFLFSHKCNATEQGLLVASRELCRILLEADPAAVRDGLNGGHLYPLHLAVENGWPCHDLLLSIFPESVALPDPRSGLLPFQIACSSCTPMGPTMSSVDVGFELLRAHPAIAARCGSDVRVVDGTMDTPAATDVGFGMAR